MVTGSADMPRGTADISIRPLASSTWPKASTGQVAAYTIPWNSSLQAAGKPQYGEFQPLDVAQFRTAFVRDEPQIPPQQSARTTMTIQVNGEPREIAAGARVAELLGELGVTQPHVAVELNLEVVPRAQHEQTMLRDGDRLEVVTLVGGG